MKEMPQINVTKPRLGSINMANPLSNSKREKGSATTFNSQRIGVGPKTKFTLPNETKTSKMRAAARNKEIAIIEKTGFAEPRH